MTLPVLASPAIAAGDDSVVITDSMSDTESATDTSADGPGFTTGLALFGTALVVARRSA
ncbi:hypothetical protein [Halorientalis salina]|uniref:hypothetical protein n=1 Tax=Halorientalis salina TaxID=2932266 RepID=UPI00145F2597|nr:hypothetical protein [Halorientalis salina]